MNVNTRKKILVIISGGLILSLCGCIHNDYNPPSEYYESEADSSSSENTSEAKETKNTPENIGERLPITRALAAKMISLTLGTAEEIDNAERIITFSDSSSVKWYDKYVNYSCLKECFDKNTEKFYPEEYLTVSQAQEILDKLDPSKKIRINITDETKDKPISYNLWTEIYAELLKNLSENTTVKDKFGITAEKSVILAVPENNKYVKEGFAITDKGLMRCEGLDLSPYIDYEISLWNKNGEIIALGDITSRNPSIKNVYITDDGGDCTIFAGGAEKSYEKTDNFMKNGNDLKIADITLYDKKASKISFAEEMKEKQIKSINNEKLICTDEESYNISPDCKVYYTQKEKVMLGGREDLLEGKTYEIFLRENTVCAFVFSKL